MQIRLDDMHAILDSDDRSDVLRKDTSPASYYFKAGFVKWQSKHPERNAAAIISESANFLSLCISENAYLVITKNCWHWASAVAN